MEIGVNHLNDLFYDFCREEVDEATVMKVVQQHPEDIDVCSFHQAIHLGMGVGAIKALISPITIKRKDCC
eukprot:442621-Ditylum_brightwellii.AAC.1